MRACYELTIFAIQCISFVLAHWGELEKTDEFRDLMLYYPDLLQEIYGSLAIEGAPALLAGLLSSGVWLTLATSFNPRSSHTTECDITGTGDQRLIESKLQ